MQPEFENLIPMERPIPRPVSAFIKPYQTNSRLEQSAYLWLSYLLQTAAPSDSGLTEGEFHYIRPALLTTKA